MDEARLIEKLKTIETIFAESSFEGERVAAERAKQRIMERLKKWAREDPPVEFKFSLGDMWARKVFLTLLRRYGISPYRYSGQRYTTVMAKLPKRFVDETLWPEFQEISEVLRGYLNEVTDRVVAQVLHADSSEAEVVPKSHKLPLQLDEKPPTSSAPDTASETRAPSDSAADKGNSTGPDRSRARRKNKKRKKGKRR